MNHFDFVDLTSKINAVKLMRFITAEHEHFHLNLVVEFYRKIVVAANCKSFRKRVYGTRLSISAESLA